MKAVGRFGGGISLARQQKGGADTQKATELGTWAAFCRRSPKKLPQRVCKTKRMHYFCKQSK
jgi:hypothetical protein